MRLVALKREAQRIATAWSNARTGIYGAAVAYCTVFSIAPILVIALAVIGLFVDSAAAKTRLISQFRATFGEGGATLIGDLVSAAAPEGASIALTIVGIIAVLLGASAIFSTIQSALDTVFGEPARERRSGIARALIARLISIGMVLSLGFVLLASLAASALIQAATERAGGIAPGIEALAFGVELLVSFVAIGGFLGLMLRFLPSKRIPWAAALGGGVMAGIGFIIGKFALGLYLGSGSAVTPYGAASALVLLILWAFYLSQVFLASAIVTKLYFTPNKN